jgi:hypothetical protein
MYAMNNDDNLRDDRVLSEKNVIQSKIKYEDFIIELERKVSGEVTISSIAKMLKKGFDGDVSKVRVDNIYAILMKIINSRFLMMKMVQDVGCGKNKAKLVLDLVQNARRRFAKESNFPFDKNVSLTAQFNDPDRKKALESWVLGNMKKDDPPIEWIQAATAALLHKDMIEDDVEIVRLIANEISTQRKPKIVKAKNSNSLLACELSNIILQQKFNKARLVKFTDITRLLDERSNSLKKELLDIKRNNDEIAETNSGLKTELARVVAEIEVIGTENELLKKEMYRVNNLFEEEKIKNKDLEVHWKTKLDQNLSGSQHELKNKLNHEISEAKLCISGETPNSAMALRRLAQMEQILERIGLKNG